MICHIHGINEMECSCLQWHGEPKPKPPVRVKMQKYPDCECERLFGLGNICGRPDCDQVKDAEKGIARILRLIEPEEMQAAREGSTTFQLPSRRLSEALLDPGSTPTLTVSFTSGATQTIPMDKLPEPGDTAIVTIESIDR